MGSSGKSVRTAGGFLAGSSGSGVTPIIPQGTTNINGVPITPVNQNNPNVQNQVPTTQNTPVVPGASTTLTQMSDDELAALMQSAKVAQMPNHLADYDSLTQKFVFQAGINEKPLVLNQADFDKFLQDNNIHGGQIMSRSVRPAQYTNQQGYQTSISGQQINDMLKYSRLNYIGGKQGRNWYGEGAYFDMNGGGSTGYGSDSIPQAVLNPQTAKVIGHSTAMRKAQQFAQTHPKFARAVGRVTNNTISIYALAMGYNVLREDGGSYHCVIDRKALVIRE